ncbi:hypothetical protein [Actinoplanes sp. NPDC049265]|uniref:hypothetical protein n=1 Tax=Actinoplanes sp. NPDC049265 TaxID=3363902 RepID=UPI00371E5D03
MAVLEDCLEFLNVTGPGQVLLRTGSTAAALDTRLTDLIGKTVTSGDVTVFLEVGQSPGAGVSEYLRNLVDKGVDVVVALIDPDTATLITDPGKLLDAQRHLKVDVHAPLDAVGSGVLPEERLLTFDTNALQAPAGALPEAYRLMPPGKAAQRAALSDLEVSPAPASVERLRNWLSGTRPSLDSSQGDFSLVAGAHFALFDTMPGGEFGALLESPRPVSLPRLQELLQHPLAPLGSDVVWSEVESGRASAALVSGWADGDARPRAFHLVRNPDDGQMYWSDPLNHGELLPANPDGAIDEHTAILERQNSTALLVNEHGAPYLPVIEAAADIPSLASVQAQSPAQSLLVGAWPQVARNTIRQQILDAVSDYGGPVIAVDVRRGRRSQGFSILDGTLKTALNESLKRFVAPPVVVATEHNDDLMWMVKNQYDGVVILPSTDRLGSLAGWEVHGEGQPESYSMLSTGALGRAGELASRALTVPAPQVVREFLGSSSWTDAERYFQENKAELLTPESLAAVQALIDQDHARATTAGPDGVMHKDHPFFVPHRALRAFGAVLNTASRAVNDPTAAPIAPTDPSLVAEAVPHTAPADESLLFGYLANRTVPGSAGAVQDGLLWLRQLILAMLDQGVTGLRPDTVLDVLAGKGELEAERAARKPASPEIYRAHASVAEALLGTIDPVHWPRSGAPHDLIKAIDCLPGLDRVAWHYLIKHDVPRFASGPAESDLKFLLEELATCH